MEERLACSFTPKNSRALSHCRVSAASLGRGRRPAKHTTAAPPFIFHTANSTLVDQPYRRRVLCDKRVNRFVNSAQCRSLISARPVDRVNGCIDKPLISVTVGAVRHCHACRAKQPILVMKGNVRCRDWRQATVEGVLLLSIINVCRIARCRSGPLTTVRGRDAACSGVTSRCIAAMHLPRRKLV